MNYIQDIVHRVNLNEYWQHTNQQEKCMAIAFKWTRVPYHNNYNEWTINIIVYLR